MQIFEQPEQILSKSSRRLAAEFARVPPLGVRFLVNAAVMCQDRIKACFQRCGHAGQHRNIVVKAHC
jgi:hypothetical protein